MLNLWLLPGMDVLKYSRVYCETLITKLKEWSIKSIKSKLFVSTEYCMVVVDRFIFSPLPFRINHNKRQLSFLCMRMYDPRQHFFFHSVIIKKKMTLNNNQKIDFIQRKKRYLHKKHKNNDIFSNVNVIYAEQKTIRRKIMKSRRNRNNKS